MSSRLSSGTAGAAFAAVVAATISGVTDSVFAEGIDIENTHDTDPLLVLSPHAPSGEEGAQYYISLPAGGSVHLDLEHTELAQIKLKGNGVTYNLVYKIKVRAK